MRLEIDRDSEDKKELLATVSERNLITMLIKVHTPGSAAMIVSGDVPDEEFIHFWLKAEPDDIHYSSETRQGEPAGEMHPETERILKRVRDAVKAIIEEEKVEIGATN